MSAQHRPEFSIAVHRRLMKNLLLCMAEGGLPPHRAFSEMEALLIFRKNKRRKRREEPWAWAWVWPLPFLHCAFCVAAALPPHCLPLSASVPAATPSQANSCWPYLLATAESWSRMRPSPSNMVSSVSLLSSTVTAEIEGFSPHRLGSSWIFIWSRQVGTAMRLMLSDEVLISTLQSRSTRRGREIWFAWASVLQVDLFKRKRWGRNNGGAMRVPSLWPLTRKLSLQRQFFIVLKS